MSRMSGLVIDQIKRMRIASNWMFHMGGRWQGEKRAR